MFGISQGPLNLMVPRFARLTAVVLATLGALAFAASAQGGVAGSVVRGADEALPSTESPESAPLPAPEGTPVVVPIVETPEGTPESVPALPAPESAPEAVPVAPAPESAPGPVAPEGAPAVPIAEGPPEVATAPAE